MSGEKLKKKIILNLPYIVIGLLATNLGEAWRLAEGGIASKKLLGLMAALNLAFQNPLPSLYPQDMLVGITCGILLKVMVYVKGKNAKKYRHNVEYGSARWSA